MEPINILIPSISQTVKEKRQEMNLNKFDLNSDATLIKHIEEGSFKPRLKTFIPDKALKTISQTLGLSEYELVFKNADNIEKFISKLYQNVIHNFPFNELDFPFDAFGDKMYNPKYGYKAELDNITDQLLDAFYFNANFTWYWYKDMKKHKENYKHEGAIPFEVSDKTVITFNKAADYFYNQIKKDLLNSFNRSFIDTTKISLRNFNNRIYAWIRSSWPSIISKQLNVIKHNHIYSIGFEVKNFLEERDYLIGIKTFTLPDIDSSKMQYEFTEEEIETTEQLKMIKTIDNLAKTYKKNANHLRKEQTKILNEIPSSWLKDMTD